MSATAETIDFTGRICNHSQCWAPAALYLRVSYGHVYMCRFHGMTEVIDRGATIVSER